MNDRLFSGWTEKQKRWAVWLALAFLVLIALLVLAGCDRGARKDLPQGGQNLIENPTDVYLFPDQYPNVAHRCVPEATTGIWTVTADWVWIVYNDPRCGGEGPIIVLDNVPGGEPAVSGG